MFSFASSAGHREETRVCSISLKKITIGDRKNHASNKKLIEDILKKSGIPYPSYAKLKKAMDKY